MVKKAKNEILREMLAGWEKERQEELSRQQFSLGLCTYCKVRKKVYRPE